MHYCVLKVDWGRGDHPVTMGHDPEHQSTKITLRARFPADMAVMLMEIRDAAEASLNEVRARIAAERIDSETVG